MILIAIVNAAIIATLLVVFIFIFTKILENGYSWGCLAINIIAMFLIYGIYFFKSRFVVSICLKELLNRFCFGGLIISGLALLCGVCFLIEK